MSNGGKGKVPREAACNAGERGVKGRGMTEE